MTKDAVHILIEADQVTGQDDDNERPEAGREGLAAAKPADAAVRRALVERQQHLLAFLHRRLGSREDAEEVLHGATLMIDDRARQDSGGAGGKFPWNTAILRVLQSSRMRRSTG